MIPLHERTFRRIGGPFVGLSSDCRSAGVEAQKGTLREGFLPGLA